MEETKLREILKNMSKKDIIEKLIDFNFYMDSFSKPENVCEWFNKVFEES